MNCSIPNCDQPADAKSMCPAHYARYRRSGSPSGMQVLRRTRPTACSVQGCVKPYKARGLCDKHYELHRRTGQLVSRQKRQRGDGTVSTGGYVVFVRHVDGRKVRIRRCRMVMEQKIGRPLLPSETVHHKNGNKQDDRPENLELWATVHLRGQRVQDLVEHAKYIIQTYGHLNLDAVAEWPAHFPQKFAQMRQTVAAA